MANPKYAGFKHVVGDASNPTTALLLEETSRALHIAEAGDSDTDWNVAADTHPSVYVHSATTPATDYIKFLHDATDAHMNVVGGNLDIDVPTSGKVTIQVNDTDEWDFDATSFVIKSGNRIDFEAAAASYATLLVDVNNNEILDTQGVASAVNQFGISNAATGNGPILASRGETNVPINLLANGTGAIIFDNGTDPVIQRFMGAAGGFNNEIQDLNGNEILALKGVTNAVNELTIENNITLAYPQLSVQGGDTNIGINFVTKAAGMVYFYLGAIATLAIHDADTNYAGAADTAANPLYLLAQNGGAASADTSGVAGAGITITAGDGSAGGAHTSNNPDGGNAGDITLIPGVGGAAGSGGSGVAGDPGKVALNRGRFHYAQAQVIDMSDAAVTLTVNPGTPTGTTLTSNLLAVDANSTGASENLLLPPEADSNGLMLIIINTGGEGIVLQNDAGSAITPATTIATAEMGIAFCNGTTWYGRNAA